MRFCVGVLMRRNEGMRDDDMRLGLWVIVRRQDVYG